MRQKGGFRDLGTSVGEQTSAACCGCYAVWLAPPQSLLPLRCCGSHSPGSARRCHALCLGSTIYFPLCNANASKPAAAGVRRNVEEKTPGKRRQEQTANNDTSQTNP